MIAQLDPLLLLFCLVFLREQLVFGSWWNRPEPPITTPSHTTATCSCLTQTSLQTIANSSPTTPGESSSPNITTIKASLSPSSNSSTIQTLIVTDCPKCSTTISPSVTTLECPACTDCSDIVHNSSLSAESQAPSPGSIIGAAVGGAVFGSILTVIVFVCIRRRSHSPDDSKEELAPNVVRNAAHQYNNGHINVDDPTPIKSTYSKIHHNTTRKAAQISPVMRQDDTIKREDVYNHLHESDKEDRSDYYDHAGPAPSLSVMEDGYGVLSMESEGNDNYNTVDRDYLTDCERSMTAENKQSNDYFILETQKG